MIFNFSQLKIKRIADLLITQEWVDNYNKDYETYDEDNPYTIEIVKSAIYELISYINFKNGRLMLYRKMILIDLSHLDKNNIGCSWSFEKNPKMHHFNPNIKGDEIVLFSLFDINDIDWDSTFIIWLIFYNNNIESRENEIKTKTNIIIDNLYLLNNNSLQEIKGVFNTGIYRDEYGITSR